MNGRPRNQNAGRLSLIVLFAFLPAPSSVAQDDAAATAASANQSAQAKLPSTFQKCVLVASLTAENLLTGTIELLPEKVPSDQSEVSRLTIGRTNLEQLRLSSNGKVIEVGADTEGNLIPLSDSPLAKVSGTWEKTGTATGDTTSWRFLLPSVAVCEIQIETDSSIAVASPDALVVSDSTTDGRTNWLVLPRNPKDVTIRCSGASGAKLHRSSTLSLTGDLELDEKELSGKWTVTGADLKTGAMLQFQFSAPCAIVNAELLDGTTLPWDYKEKTRRLTIDVPAGTSSESLSIGVSRKKASGFRRDIPIPVPVRSAAATGDRDESAASVFRLQSSNVRIGIAPSLLVVDHDLRGLYERDITWTSDGRQTLDLVQFDTEVKAVLLTTPSHAILDDATVTLFNPNSSPGIAVVYLEVKALAGRRGRLEYGIPTAWQVTGVSDATTGKPLLFRMMNETRRRQDRRFETWLRTPLQPNTTQRLIIQLQSTETNRVNLFAPRLVGDARRRLELFATTDNSDFSGFGFLPAESEDVVPDWLPVSEFEAAKYFRPGQLARLDTPAGPVAPPQAPAVADELEVPPKAPVAESLRQVVTGTTFQILTRNHEQSFNVECLARLNVSSGNELRFRIPDVVRIQTFVNGRPCFSTEHDSTFTLPLEFPRQLNVVDLSFTTRSGLNSAATVAVPLIIADTSEATEINTVLISASDVQPTASNSDDAVELIDFTSARQLPLSVFGGADGEEFNAEIRPFMARWQLSSAKFATLIHSKEPGPTFPVRLRNPRFDAAALFFASAIFAVFWLLLMEKRWLSPVGQGACLVMLSVAAVFALSPLHSIITSAAVMLFVVILLRSLRHVTRRVAWRTLGKWPVRRLSKLAAILLFVSALSSVAGDEKDSPDGALVVTCKISVTLETRQSALAVIDCQTASRPGKMGLLKIPVDRLTLIDCQAGGQSILPRRSGNDQLELMIPSTKSTVEASSEEVDAELESPGWSRQRVTYTVRGVPQWSAGVCRLRIPHPIAPQTSVELSDETGLISEAALQGEKVAAEPDTLGSWTFKDVAERGVLELALTGSEVLTTVDSEQVVSVECEMDVSPPELKMTTTYSFSESSPVAEIVRIGTSPEYRITAIEDRSGNALLWSFDGDVAAVRIPQGMDRRAIVVRQMGELPLKLKHRISLGEMLAVDGRAVAESTLRVRTSDRFFVETVADNKGQLVRLDTPGSTASAVFRVGRTARSITVALRELSASREASLLQTVSVDEEEIRWSAECRLTISVQPIYRQRVRLSESVDVTSITAERGGVSLIRAWTRNREELVVAFREATRGDVSLNLTGVIPRRQDEDTRLPSISLPDAEVLEASLELNTVDGVEAMVGDLGSGLPEIVIDLESESIPSEPFRMILRDENEPPSIRRSPQRRLLLQAAVVLYELGGQSYAAEILSLPPEGARRDLHVRIRSDFMPASQPLVFRGAKPVDVTEENGEFTIPKSVLMEPEQPTTIVVSDLAISGTSGRQIIPLPDFDTSVRVGNASVFDCRSSVAAGSANPLPGWVRDGLSLTETVDKASGQAVSDFEFDQSTMLFQIRTVVSDAPVEDRRNQIVSAFGTHDVSLDRDVCVVQSDFLLFAPSVNPEASLLLPSDIELLELRVNGQPRAFHRVGAYCELLPSEKINHVSLRWVGSFQTDGDRLRLPVVANTVSENIAIVTLQQPMQKKWKILNDRLTSEQFVARRGESIRRSLRLVSPAVSGTLSDELKLENPESVFWQQMIAESPRAADSFRKSLTTLRRSVADSDAIVNADDRVLKVSQAIQPSMLQLSGMLIGTVILFASLLRSSHAAKVDPAERSVVQVGPSAIVNEATKIMDASESSDELPDDGRDSDHEAVDTEDV